MLMAGDAPGDEADLGGGRSSVAPLTSMSGVRAPLGARLGHHYSHLNTPKPTTPIVSLEPTTRRLRALRPAG